MKIPEGYTVRVYVDESKLQFTYNSYYIGDLSNNYSDMLTKNSSNEIYGEFVVNKDILDFQFLNAEQIQQPWAPRTIQKTSVTRRFLT